MFSVTKNSDTTQPYIVEITADTEADVAKLPTHYTPGSTCLVIAESKVYILNHNHEWVEL